ncbi:Nickel uptake substrate-specific transmembrane region [Enhygromyxa salina]|uniref:Nickel uptake substrate-specific transmembrane region n=1 Tax=Enhygromyxa salina TaxID=215803 RepID=A0A2S9YK09_9BACT|nr:carboxypeptidase regulatory-like domain-containing protein [Enhygromyxa salina]PRQ05435.1 Nickel uptake substrate-specific transmembrane region [Enhygromyxa salina]
MADEREPPGELDRAEPGDDPTPRSGVGAALLAMVLMVFAATWTSRCDREAEATAEVSAGGADDEHERTRKEEDERPTLITGIVLRELPLGDEVEGPASVQAKPSAEALADPELAALLEDLPAWTLEPPGEQGCRVRAWQEGQLVGREVNCEADGRYALTLEPGVRGRVQVEMLIPGQLRGLVDADVPKAGPLALATVALGPGHTVSGQTVDARGEPLAEVRVQVLPRPTVEGGQADGAPHEQPVPWRTVSDAEGRFEFTTLPYGPVSLRAIKSGYALSVVEAVAPEDAVLMVLDELIDLEGAVVADASLIERAVVRLEGSSVWPAIERPLAADGSFVFEQLPDGIYGVEVTVPGAPGEQAQEFASVPLENITPDLRINLALVPAFRVPVRVVDPDGEPVLSARVTLGYGQLGMLQKSAETDSEGRVRVGPVVPGPYFVRADADGFLPPESVEVEVGPEGFAAEEQVLVLIRPAKIEGVVVDEDDRPVAGADVLLDGEVAFAVGESDTRRRMFAVAIGADEGSLGVTTGEVPDIPLFGADEDEGALGSIVTDEDGRFEIDLLLPGAYRIWAMHGEHAASAVSSFELRSGEVRGGLRLQLREGVPLTGVVRSANGQPLSGIQVDLGDGLVLTTDDRGVFDAGFRRGRQELILRGVGMIPKVVEVELGDAGVDVEVALEPARGRFEGRVVDGNGQPIVDVEVELHPRDGLSPSLITWTDARGLYEFEALAPGPVELEFHHLDYVSANDDALVDESAGIDHERVLETGWSAAVLVRSAVRGDPLDGVELLAGDVSATTDKQGRATLTRLVGDPIELEVRAPGWVGQTLALRDDGTGRISVTIELAEGGSISGTVDDDIGEAIANARVELRSLGGELLGATLSDGRGRWRVDGVPAGDVLIRAEPPPALSAVLAPVELRSDVIRGEVTTAVRLRFEQL